MKITAVKTIPLGGPTHDHGWPGGTDPTVQYNTLIEVIGEDGFVVIGSCYTKRQLVEGSLAPLLPHMPGESALHPHRVSAKLGHGLFWPGPCARVVRPTRAHALVSAAVFHSLLVVAPLFAEPRALKPDDFAAMRDVADPRLTPDGGRVVYTVRPTDLAKAECATNPRRP